MILRSTAISAESFPFRTLVDLLADGAGRGVDGVFAEIDTDRWGRSVVLFATPHNLYYARRFVVVKRTSSVGQPHSVQDLGKAGLHS